MKSNSDKIRYLAKNMGFMTISSFASKLISFFLVPLYTNILSTSDYGIIDLFGATISILVPVLTLNVQESVMRFSMDKTYNKKDVLSVGIRYVVLSSYAVAAGLAVNYIFCFFEPLKSYTLFFFGMYVTSSAFDLALAYVRGNEKIKELTISGIFGTLINLLLIILFLVGFGWGIKGYFAAGLIGSVIQLGFIMFVTRIFGYKRSSPEQAKLKKDMLTYSRPTVLNAVAWWVNISSDRYLIIYFLNTSENGIYSVASKIPSILSIIQSIFSQAWTLSAVKDYDPEDKNGFFSGTYSLYNCVVTLGCSCIITGEKILAKFIYAKDFFPAWRYVPWLTISVVFGALSGYFGGLYFAVKDTKIYARSSVIGAISNIAMNLVLIPFLGALGAAIATAVSYMIIWVMRTAHSRKYIKLKINFKRDIISYIVLILQAVIILVIEGPVMYAVQSVLTLSVVFLYFKEIKIVLEKLIGRRKMTGEGNE